MITSYIGLGSNLDNPREQIERALATLDNMPDTRLVARSPLYRSTPLGPAGQPDYINAVAEIATGLAPRNLLTALQAIENRQGRVRGQRWGARTLDLDILLYGDRQLREPDLVIPHPEMANRNFVLYPLADLAPDLVLPDGRPLQALLANVPSDGIVRLSAGDHCGSTGQRS